MKKSAPIPSLAQRFVMLDGLARELNRVLVQTQRYSVEVIKKISTLAEVPGFDVTLSPILEKDYALSIMWSCEKRREGISGGETKEIELMIANVEAVGFKKIEVQHDSHKIFATFRVR